MKKQIERLVFQVEKQNKEAAAVVLYKGFPALRRGQGVGRIIDLQLALYMDGPNGEQELNQCRAGNAQQRESRDNQPDRAKQYFDRRSQCGRCAHEQCGRHRGRRNVFDFAVQCLCDGFCTESMHRFSYPCFDPV